MKLLKRTNHYKGRGNRKSILMNKNRTIIKQVYEYLKKHGIIKNRDGIKNNKLISMFMESVGWEVPDNTNKIVYLLDIYESGEYSFLRAHIDRPDIEPHIWRELRNRVFETYGKICLKCGSTDNVAVDHIKPYSIYPELCVEFNNLQPLCRSCNSVKGNREIIDYRIL